MMAAPAISKGMGMILVRTQHHLVAVAESTQIVAMEVET